MNYMFELVEFDRWMEGERPGTAAIVLWYALMRMCNRAGWKNPFPAAVSSLMEKTGLSRCSVYRARKELQALGRIVFTERGGRRCAEYYIVPFEEASGVVSPVVSHVASQIDIDSETILKQNKTKEERITPIPPQGDCAAPEDAASFFIKEQPAHPKAVPQQPAAKGGAPEANDAPADDETRRIPSPTMAECPLRRAGVVDGGTQRIPSPPMAELPFHKCGCEANVRRAAVVRSTMRAFKGSLTDECGAAAAHSTTEAFKGSLSCGQAGGSGVETRESVMESPLVEQKGGAWQRPGGRALRFVPQPEEIGEDSPQDRRIPSPSSTELPLRKCGCEANVRRAAVVRSTTRAFKGSLLGERTGGSGMEQRETPKGSRAAGRNGVRKTRERTGAADIGFEAFWVAYPRRVKRKDAQRAWAKLAPNEALKQRILSDIAQKAATQDWRREGGRYIPYPASYLNGARWEDEPARPTSMFDDFLAFEMPEEQKSGAF